MARRGELFDQDAEDEPAANPWGPPLRAGRGVLYDQDASTELPRIDPLQAARYQRELDRRRERRIELERDRRSNPPARRAPAPVPPRTPPRATIQITSSPMAARAAPGPSLPPSRPSPAAGGPRSTSRATAVLAAGTFASRLTGFVRVLVIGYVLGVGALSDAFNYANGIPNIVYDLLLGGILSATLVPVFVEALDAGDHGEPGADPARAISAVLTAIAAALAAISVLLWLAAPAVIRFYLLLGHGPAATAERTLATRLLRWFAPQVFFLGTTVATTALLNARRRFAAAAVSPVINNVIAIAALLATKFAAEAVLTRKGAPAAQTLDAFGRDGRAVLILGAGTTLGYAVQLVVQLPAVHRLGLRLRPVWEPRHPAVHRVARLSSWLLGVVLANQASLALVMILAGRTQGGVTAYQFGYQFFQLPYALIAVSVAAAIMPDLAEHWSARPRRRAAFERQLVTGLRVSLAVLTPVALIYAVVAGPFIQLAIHHGAVGAHGAHLVAVTLVYFLVGLPGFSAFFLLMRAFQAMQDGPTMFRIYLLENLLTVVGALALSPILGVPGLALAWTGPYTIASLVAVARLRRRVGNLGGALTVRALVRITVASLAAGAAAWVIGLAFPARAGDPVVVARLVVQAGAGAGVYLAAARALGVRELRPLLAFASRAVNRR